MFYVLKFCLQQISVYPRLTYYTPCLHTRVRMKKQESDMTNIFPIGVALMLVCCLVTIFVISPQSGGYGGGTNQLAFWEAAGVMWAGVLIGYVALIFRAV